jgi:hypothetical protein
MSSNIAEFDRRLARKGREIGLKVANRKQELAVEAVEIAVSLSPVAKKNGGEFKGAWRISESRSMAAPDTPDTEGGATIERARRDAESIEPFGVVHVVNAMPYAGRIENGWSGQAPQGVLGQTFQRLRARLRSRR